MATPYVPFNPGTVAVTNGSKAIVGTGTSFTVYEPFDFLMIDGIGPVMLETITDATHATAVFNVTATGSGKAYRWVPMADVTRALTLYQGLSAVLSSGNMSAFAQLIGAANKVPFFTGAGTMDVTALTAFARSLLDDPDAETMLVTLGLSPTSTLALLGLNLVGVGATPLLASRTGSTTNVSQEFRTDGGSVFAGQGAAGKFAIKGDANLASSPWIEVDSSGISINGSRAYNRGNILAAVALSGGVPTGGIIESGNNANGDYVRLANGTQLCWSTIPIPYNSSSVLRGDWAFPAAFSASPKVMCLPNFATPTGNLTAASYTTYTSPVVTLSSTTTVGSVRFARGAGAAFVSGDGINGDIFAIGKCL